MATPLQASALQKATTTAGITTGVTGLTAGAKSLNGAHATAHTSSGVAAAASNAYHMKASESIASSLVHENRTTTSSSNLSIKQSSTHESVSSICLSEEQKHILHQGTCSLGDALSQVPWMKFRLVAEPNMDVFAKDKRLRTFIHEVTDLTVSIVTKQCTDEISILVKQLVSSLTFSMESRVNLIMETVIKQIAALCLEDTMTACQNLHGIKETVCFGPDHEHHRHGTHGDHHHHHDSGKHHHHYDIDSDKHHHHHGDKHSHDSHDNYSSDKQKRSNGYDHGESEKSKLGDTPTKKHTGKSTPVPVK